MGKHDGRGGKHAGGCGVMLFMIPFYLAKHAFTLFMRKAGK